MYFCHIRLFLFFFFLIFNNIILTLCSINITYDYTFVIFGSSLIFFSHLVVFLFFFLTFDGTILTLCSTNITCDCTFVTFGGSLIFFLHLMVLSSHSTISTSNVTVLLLHSIVPLFFFSHLIIPSSHCAVPISHMTVLYHIRWFPYFFTYDSTIITLCSSNITCDCTFVTFGSSFIFFFSHLMVPSSHCAVLTSHVLYFCHIRWFLYFFHTFDGTILTLCNTNITCKCTFVAFDGSLIFSHIRRYHSHIV